MTISSADNGTSGYFSSLHTLEETDGNSLGFPSDLDFIEAASRIDFGCLQGSSCVRAYWRHLATESTKPRPLINQPNLLPEHSYYVSIATPENAWDIAELVVKAFSEGDVFRKVGQRRTSEAEVVEDMKTPFNRWYIVTMKTRIVAAMLYISESDTEASVNMLSAHPDFWRKKIGIYLIEMAESIAKKEGKTNLSLSAAQINKRLISYYENLGFEKIEGREEEEYFSPEFQREYLKLEYQGYEENGKAKLRNYDMTKALF